MGVVYQALDREANVHVALKTLKNASAESLARLKREFRAMQDVQHPNLVTLRELVFEDGRWFIVMDLVQGTDFVSHIRAYPGAGSASDPTIPTAGSAPTIRALPPISADAPLFDEPRLRAALRQLVEALQACHAAGFVHRDIKPSNVLVTPAGKVTVLDFGLVVDTRADASSMAIVGTPAYMAPEQAASENVGPEADWYSVGVLLYVALAGRTPFEGAALQVMLRKQSEKPVPPSAICAAVPPDLDALCVSLLQPTASERPSGGAVLRALGAAPSADADRSRTLTPPFVGREKELEELAAAFTDARTKGVCSIVDGESGVGKSRLVRRFAERLALEDPSAIVLFGRCFERESVPYKAFDGIVDALARLLARLPDAESRALLPARPAALVQVFPVLRRVPAISTLVRDAQTAVDPFELRDRAFAALREMLVRIAERRPLLLVIDDGQWADDDSHTLLAEVLREPDAPRMLLVVTVRGSSDGIETNTSSRSNAAARLGRTLGPDSRAIHLAPLPPDTSLELASLLLERLGDHAPTHAAIIAANAAGHPLFIDILARKVEGSAELARSSASSLEDVLRASLSELDSVSRAILEVISLADAPLRLRVVAAALRHGSEHDASFDHALKRLRVSRLVVGTGGRGDDVLEPYHDRVRTAVLTDVTDDRRTERHRAIAEALETMGDAQPQALARHWAGAGDAARAARYSVLAGDQAAQALAFDRAASYYERALQVPEIAGEERRKVKARLGDALANSGRGKPAADALREAAVGAPAAEELELRRRAAEQLLRTGHFDEGVPALEKVLRSVGARLPPTVLVAIAQLLILRAWLFVRGLRYRRRDQTQVSAEAMVRVDTRWSAAVGLALTDPVRGGALQAINLLAALHLGEPYRAARAIALETTYCATAGTRSWDRTQELIARAAEEAEACGNVHARLLARLCGGTAYYLTGRYVAALDSLDEALVIARDYARDVSWEIASGEIFAIIVLGFLGRLRDLRDRVHRVLPEMTRRADLHGSTNLRVGWCNLAWLVGDDTREARQQIDDAMAAWRSPGFNLTSFWELLARLNLGLYSGDAAEAHRLMQSQWGPMTRSMLPRRIQSTRVFAWDFHARTSLALAEADVARRRELLRAVERDTLRMTGEGLPHADARAASLRAGVACVMGRTTDAVRLLREALAGFTAEDLAMNAAVVRSVLGQLVGGDEGSALRDEAARWFAAQSVKRPEGFVAMLAPGFGKLAR